GVEHGNADAPRRVEIDLVGADGETADRHQPVGGLQHIRRELGARADAEHMDARKPPLQLVRIKRLLQPLDLAVALGLEQANSGVVHILEQEDADFILGERQRHGCSKSGLTGAAGPDGRIDSRARCAAQRWLLKPGPPEAVFLPATRRYRLARYSL